MSARWNVQTLLGSVSADSPCGLNLEGSDDLRLLEAYQIFGQITLEPEAKKDGDPVPSDPRKSKSDRPPNWGELGDLAFGMLSKSHDVGVLAHLGAAVLRVDGPRAFVQTLSVVSSWLTGQWAQVYPLVDEDAVFRRNALNNLADRVAMLDGLRRSPLAEHRQHGRFALKDLEARGAQKVDDSAPADAQVDAAFAAMPIADLTALHACAGEGQAALASIKEACRTNAGNDAVPDFDALEAEFRKLEVVLRTRLARHPEGVVLEGADEGVGGAGATAVGAIRSREDAIRALDAVAEFFRRNEPSSPLPMIVDRAKRLVSKDFLEVLADVAPDALPQARAAGGIRE